MERKLKIIFKDETEEYLELDRTQEGYPKINKGPFAKEYSFTQSFQEVRDAIQNLVYMGSVPEEYIGAKVKLVSDEDHNKLSVTQHHMKSLEGLITSSEILDQDTSIRIKKIYNEGLEILNDYIKELNKKV